MILVQFGNILDQRLMATPSFYLCRFMVETEFSVANHV